MMTMNEYEMTALTADDINDIVLVDSVAYEEVDVNELSEAVRVAVDDAYEENDDGDNIHSYESDETSSNEDGESQLGSDYE